MTATCCGGCSVLAATACSHRARVSVIKSVLGRVLPRLRVLTGGGCASIATVFGAHLDKRKLKNVCRFMTVHHVSLSTLELAHLSGCDKVQHRFMHRSG